MSARTDENVGRPRRELKRAASLSANLLLKSLVFDAASVTTLVSILQNCAA